MLKNVLDYLDISVEKYPDKTAVADQNNSYTYTELQDKAKRAGAGLLSVTQPHMAVPVYMDKSCEALAVFMGAVNAGCFYVMLDPSHPAERINMILETLGATFMVVNEKSAKKQAKPHD